jgi:hypothetical protein
MPVGTRLLGFREQPEVATVGGLISALAGVGLGQAWLVAAGGAVLCGGVLLRAFVRLRTGRLRGAIAATLTSGTRDEVFARLSAVLGNALGCDWTGLVAWDEDGLDGVLERSRGEAPPEQAVMSWLVREAESREELLAATPHELSLPGDGLYVALPLRRENSALVGFVVLRSPRPLPRFARAALVESLDGIGLALADRPGVAEAAPVVVAVASR